METQTKAHKKQEEVLKPEEKFLITIARQDFTEEDILKLKKLVEKGLDYEYLATLARKHRVASLVGYNLSMNKQIKDEINIPNKKFVRAMVLSNIQTQVHNKKMYQELDRLQRLFDKHDLKFVILKGPVLAKKVYKYPGVRPFGDLDLLVSPDDVLEIHQIFKNDGYIPLNYGKREATDKEVYNFAEKKFHLFPYSKKSDQFSVEIHQFGKEWDIEQQFNYEKIYKEAIRSKLHKEKIYIPSLINLFLWSCIHLAHHYFPIIFDIKACRFFILKLLMDIRESYFTMKNSYKINEYKPYVKENKELIENNIAITEKIYSKFTDESIPCSKKYKKSLDWHGKKWSSYLSQRLFSLEKEYKKLISKYKKIRECKTITGSYQESNCINNKIKSSEEIISTEKNWDRHDFSALLNETPYKKNEFNCKGKLNTAWNKEYFIVEITLVCNIEINSIDNTKFSYRSKLLFGKCNNFPHKIVVNPEYGKKDCFFGGKELDNKRVDLKFKERYDQNHHYVKLRIPWEYIGIKPAEGKEFLMDVNIIENNENTNWKNYKCLSWSTGKYYMLSWKNKCYNYCMNKVRLEK